MHKSEICKNEGLVNEGNRQTDRQTRHGQTYGEMDRQVKTET